MQTSSGVDSGYASLAILTALLKHLAEINVVTPQAVSDILEEASRSIESVGPSRVGVISAIKIIAEMRSDLAKKGVL